MKILPIFIIFFNIIFYFSTSIFAQNISIELLKEGKQALDSGNFIKAHENLTKSIIDLKEIGDYIIFWNAKALVGMGKYSEALNYLSFIKKSYPTSPILKEVRKEEIGLLKKLNNFNLNSVYQSYITDYPDDLSIKFEYGQYLKEQGNSDLAKKIFKEIFLTATSYADKAELELKKDDITVEDLIKKSKALNSNFMFSKSESYLKEALQRAKKSQQDDIFSVLGYSLFMQKKYNESAEVYKKVGDPYWRGRSLLRAKEFGFFEKEMNDYIKSGDMRIGDLFINYANIKRRSGNHSEAIRILKMVIEKYPSSKEDAMWNLGWNYYLMGKHDEANELFRKLYSNYGKLKYLYWSEKVFERKGIYKAKENIVSFRAGDVYSYLLYSKGRISRIPETELIKEELTLPIRVELLLRADLKEEALREIKINLRNNRDEQKIPVYSRILYNLGDYPTSVRIISKFPGRQNYHDLFYPQVYSDIIFRVATRFAIEPSLIYAIMREESRFDRLAISPAGALGIMQLMPSTARREGKKIGLTIKNDNELFDPEKNITIGTFYLKNLISEFGNLALAIAAYNAGEKVVANWISENKYNSLDEFMEDIPFAETRAYVQRVLASYFEYHRINNTLSKEKIFQIIKIRGG